MKEKRKARQFFGGDIRLITANDISNTLDVHIESVRRYIRRGDLKARKIGRSFYITEKEFKNFLSGKN